MAEIRDWAIWRSTKGQTSNLKTADAKTSKLPEVKTNYKPSNKKNGTTDYLSGQETIKKLKLPEDTKSSFLLTRFVSPI